MNKLPTRRLSLVIMLCAAMLQACGEDTSSANSTGSTTGVGGSTARMTIVGDYLYAISGRDIQLFDIAQPQSPNPWLKVPIDWEIQTLFPYGDYLLVGAADGVHILDNTDQSSPRYIADFTHATAVDPVVAENGFAYVTLKSDVTRPNGFIADQMNVLDINDISNPQLIFEQPMQGPEGLALIDGQLYVCDGTAGLKIFDLADPRKPVFSSGLLDVDCNDAIARNGILYLITDTELHQYDYSVTPPVQLSVIGAVSGL